jgi:hypothetical protein
VVDWYISSLPCFFALSYTNNLDLTVENEGCSCLVTNVNAGESMLTINIVNSLTTF